MGFYFCMPRKNIGRDSPLLLSAKFNTCEKNKKRKNKNTKYNINNKLHTKLNYFLNAAPRRLPKQLMEQKPEVEGASSCIPLVSVCLSHPGGSASSSGLAPPELVWLWQCPHGPCHCRVETLWICPPASDVCCASALSTLCLRPSTATAGLQTENSNWLILCCSSQVPSTWQEPTPTKAHIEQFLTLADILAMCSISFIFCRHHDVPGCHPSLCLQAKSFHATVETT